VQLGVVKLTPEAGVRMQTDFSMMRACKTRTGSRTVRKTGNGNREARKVVTHLGSGLVQGLEAADIPTSGKCAGNGSI
jgi:hypothetical protein